jgi:glycosyltransferase involved in cell wall biosynthesis
LTTQLDSIRNEYSVALVHDRLDQNGGAERVLGSLHEMFPRAPIYVSMWNESLVTDFVDCEVRTSWMQRLPAIKQRPRIYAPLYPLAFAALDLKEFDLVISSSTSFAHGVSTRPDALHVCYCNSPSNFVWRPDSYFVSNRQRLLSAPLRPWLRFWERRSAKQPDLYVANSANVAGRIRAFYGRNAVVIPPPIRDFWFTDHQSSEFFLVVSRLVPQKRIDLAIEACAALAAPLVIAGEGRSSSQLQALAGPQTRFVGRVSDDELRSLYSCASALLVPGEEDFGLVPVEAQAAGTPVIGYDAGGVRETVIDGITGIRFAPQTKAALVDAMLRFKNANWEERLIRENASRYSETRFQTDLSAFIAERLRLSGFEQATPPPKGAAPDSTA